MNNTSHTAMEQHRCEVCGRTYDVGVLSFDRRLRTRLPTHVVTEWGLCAEHQRLHQQGFVALVEVDPQRSRVDFANQMLNTAKAFRTGAMVHLKREVFGRTFNVDVSDDAPCIFVAVGVIDSVRARVATH